MISSAANLPPTVAGVDQLLGLAAQEAEHPDTHPAPEEDEEHEDAEDIRAAPALGDVVLWVVLAHSFETLECYWDYHFGHRINANKKDDAEIKI